MVPLLDVASLFLLTRDRQIPSRAPDMAIRHEQSGRGGTLQSNNTPQGGYRKLGLDKMQYIWYNMTNIDDILPCILGILSKEG